MTAVADDTGRPGNREFARLLAEAGYADRRRAFARLVDGRAEEYGTEFDYDHTAVKRWLAGAIPKPPAPDAIADTLSDLLGYPVSPADLGWPTSSADDRGLLVEVVPARTLSVIAGLTGRTMNRRDLLRSAAAAGAVAFSDAALHSLTGSYELLAAGTGSGGRLGVVDVALIRETTAGYRRLDARFGAGELLDDVVAFLHVRTKRALDATYSEVVGRDLFTALADLAKLAGWMARDLGQPGLAQRCFIQSLALAEHAGDRSLAAGVLDAMSHQAMAAREPQRAVALARAARMRVGDSGSAAQDAALRGTEANALALAGDRRACAKALAAADAAWERHGQTREPPWMTHYADTDVVLKTALSHRLMGQVGPAEQLTQQALTLSPPERVRHRASCQIELAITRVASREPARVDVDGAVAAGLHALDLAAELRSARVADAVRTLQGRLAPWQERVAVREFNHRADAVLRTAA
jgi:hypothetical protein